MKIEKTSTGLRIKEPTDTIKQKCLRYFSLVNPVREYFIYSGNDPDHKPIFGKEKDVIYITSGFLKINDREISQLKYSTIQSPVGKKISIEMNRQPRSDLQRDCIKKLTTSTSNKITVELKPGVGKEQPYSTKIPTPTKQGYTLMGDLKLGDYVFDRTGKLTKIIGIFEQGEKDVYKITFQDGRTAYCGADHLWTVKTHKNGVWKTVMLKDMLNDFKRESPWKKAQGRQDPYAYKYYIPTCQPVSYPKQDVPIDPWVLGCFIGNGCCTEKNLVISSGTDEVPNKIARLCGFEVKKNPANYSYGFYDRMGKPIRAAEFFKAIPEMVGCYSRDKKIPDVYMINDVDTRLRLLQGLMDTDGSISYSKGRYHVRYTSTSKTLLDQIVQMLYSFGYSGNIIEDKRHDKYVDGYCGGVIFRIPNSIKQHFFTIPSKKIPAISAADQKQENHYNDLLIKDICFSHRERSRCIMVDNPEHLYLTEDFIVTHNTFIALYSISILGLKPLIIAPTKLLKNQWIDNFVECGIDKSDIATNIYDAPNKTFCVVTISSIENELRKDWHGLLKVMDEANFGIRVTDEAHLHLKGNLKFDAICNIKYNWYLSATLGRSDVSEDNILNRALLDADRFVGSRLYEEYKHSYINVYFQDVYYYPSSKLCFENFKYGSKGLIKATYYQMLIKYYDGKPLIRNIINITKRCRGLIDYGKMVLVIPLLSIIDMVVEEMKKDPFFNKYSFGSIDGSMSMATRKEVMDGDIILRARRLSIQRSFSVLYIKKTA